MSFTQTVTSLRRSLSLSPSSRARSRNNSSQLSSLRPLSSHQFPHYILSMSEDNNSSTATTTSQAGSTSTTPLIQPSPGTLTTTPIQQPAPSIQQTPTTIEETPLRPLAPRQSFGLNLSSIVEQPETPIQGTSGKSERTAPDTPPTITRPSPISLHIASSSGGPATQGDILLQTLINMNDNQQKMMGKQFELFDSIIKTTNKTNEAINELSTKFGQLSLSGQAAEPISSAPSIISQPSAPIKAPPAKSDYASIQKGRAKQALKKVTEFLHLIAENANKAGSSAKFINRYGNKMLDMKDITVEKAMQQQDAVNNIVRYYSTIKFVLEKYSALPNGYYEELKNAPKFYTSDYGKLGDEANTEMLDNHYSTNIEEVEANQHQAPQGDYPDIINNLLRSNSDMRKAERIIDRDLFEKEMKKPFVPLELNLSHISIDLTEEEEAQAHFPLFTQSAAAAESMIRAEAPAIAQEHKYDLITTPPSADRSLLIDRTPPLERTIVDSRRATQLSKPTPTPTRLSAADTTQQGLGSEFQAAMDRRERTTPIRGGGPPGGGPPSGPSGGDGDGGPPDEPPRRPAGSGEGGDDGGESEEEEIPIRPSAASVAQRRQRRQTVDRYWDQALRDEIIRTEQRRLERDPYYKTINLNQFLKNIGPGKNDKAYLFRADTTPRMDITLTFQKYQSKVGQQIKTLQLAHPLISNELETKLLQDPILIQGFADWIEDVNAREAWLDPNSSQIYNIKRDQFSAQYGMKQSEATTLYNGLKWCGSKENETLSEFHTHFIRTVATYQRVTGTVLNDNLKCVRFIQAVKAHDPVLGIELNAEMNKILTTSGKQSTTEELLNLGLGYLEKRGEFAEERKKNPRRSTMAPSTQAPRVQPPRTSRQQPQQPILHARPQGRGAPIRRDRRGGDYSASQPVSAIHDYYQDQLQQMVNSVFLPYMPSNSLSQMNVVVDQGENSQPQSLNAPTENISQISKFDSYAKRSGQLNPTNNNNASINNNNNKSGNNNNDRPRIKVNKEQMDQLRFGCNYCKKPGHYREICFKLKADQQGLNQPNESLAVIEEAQDELDQYELEEDNEELSEESTDTMAAITEDTLTSFSISEPTTVRPDTHSQFIPGLSYGTFIIGQNVIKKNQTIEALTDTGCSIAGAMNLSTYKAMEQQFPTHVKMAPPKHKLNAAGKRQPLSVVGSVKLPLYDTRGVHIEDIEFAIIDNLMHNLIIGNPILSKGQTSKYQNNRAKFTGKNAAGETIKVPLRIYRDARDINGRIYNVVLENPINIPPQSTQLVKAKLCYDNDRKMINQLKDRKILSDYSVELSPKAERIGKIKIDHSISKLFDDNSIIVQVSNASINPITLSNALLGTATIVYDPIENQSEGKSLNNIINNKDEEKHFNYKTEDEEISPEIEAPSIKKVGLDSITDVKKFIAGLEKPSYLNDNEWKNFINNAVLPYANIMIWKNKDPDEAAKRLGIAHAINLKEGTQSKAQRPYPTTEAGRQATRDEVADLRSKNIVSDSTSEWASPPIIQKKSDGSWRFIVDLRYLNENTIKDVYPLPRIDHILDSLRKAKYITTIDLASGYFQIPIKKEDRAKTAFAYDGGLAEFNFMAQGLCNAPATFQRLMDRILAPFKFQFCFVYLDDIIIFSESLEDHINHVKKVFETLQKYDLIVSIKKCQLVKNSVTFLGHRVSNGMISLDPKKVEAIKQLLPPKNIRQLRSYVGLVGYYRHFIPNFSTIAEPLTRLNRKNARFIWTSECQNAFNVLNEALIQEPVLRCSDPSKEFILHTDASDSAIGAILSQKDDDGQEYAVAYISRTLNPHERRYDTTQKEGLAVVWSTKKFYPYIGDRKFTIVTDHSALKWLLKTSPPPNQRLARWIMHLQSYDFEVVHRPGVKHQNADALSRLEQKENTEAPEAPDDNINQENHQCNPYDSHNLSINIICSIIDEQDPLQSALLKQHQLDDPYCVNIRYFIDRAQSFPSVQPDLSKEKEALADIKKHNYIISNDLVCKKGYEEAGLGVIAETVPLIPQSLQQDILIATHEGSINSHPGTRVMFYIIRPRCYWPGLQESINNYVQSCHICQLNRGSRPSLYIPALTLPIPSRPFELIGMDALALPTSNNGNNTLIVFTCYLTKFAEAAAIRCIKAGSPTADQVAQLFIELIVSRYGVPESVLSDKGKAFIEGAMKKVIQLLDIKQRTTSPYHPQANGLTERFNRTFINMARNYTNTIDKLDWDIRLPQILLAYRNHYHRDSRQSPFFLLFGRTANLPINFIIGAHHARYRDKEEYIREHVQAMPMIWKFCTENLVEQARKVQEETRRLAEQNKLLLYKVDDPVYLYAQTESTVSEKLSYRWKGPYIIKRIITDATYEIAPENQPQNTYICWGGHLKLAIDKLPPDHQRRTELTQMNNLLLQQLPHLRPSDLPSVEL